MQRALCLMALALWVGAVSAAPPRISSYNAECHACGEKRVPMGSHTFCALSYVHSGGFNSYCAIHGSPKAWSLVAKDPDGGETQACGAICLNLDGTGAAADPVIAPPPTSPVSRPTAPTETRTDPATAEGPEALGPYQSTFGTLSMRRSGNRVTGTYTHKSGRVEGTLSGNTLTGRWTQSNGEGRLVFRFNPDYSGFSGQWSYGDATPDKEWTGRR